MTIDCECKEKGIPSYLWCGKECDRHSAAIANIREMVKLLPYDEDQPFNLPNFHGQILRGKTNDNA